MRAVEVNEIHETIEKSDRKYFTLHLANTPSITLGDFSILACFSTILETKNTCTCGVSIFKREQ